MRNSRSIFFFLRVDLKLKASCAQKWRYRSIQMVMPYIIEETKLITPILDAQSIPRSYNAIPTDCFYLGTGPQPTWQHTGPKGIVVLSHHSVHLWLKPMFNVFYGFRLMPPISKTKSKRNRFWYCRNRVSSCNITYVVQQDTQLLSWLNIYSQYVWQLDMFRTYRSIFRSICKLCVAGLVCEDCVLLGASIR